MSETIYNNDISGLANINELYESSLHRPERKMRQTFYKKIKILLFSLR